MACFAHGLGAALMERVDLRARGNFPRGTLPTIFARPPWRCRRHRDRPRRDGRRRQCARRQGHGRRRSHAHPTAITNAVADALGRDDITLPLNLRRISAEFANGMNMKTDELEAGSADPNRGDGRRRRADGKRGSLPLRSCGGGVAAAPGSERACRHHPGMSRPHPGWSGWLLGSGGDPVLPVFAAPITRKSRCTTRKKRALCASWARPSGHWASDRDRALVNLRPEAGGRTRLQYRYEADVGGKVRIGQRMLGSVTRYLIAQFFHSLERRLRPGGGERWSSWWSKLRRYGRSRGSAMSR